MSGLEHIKGTEEKQFVRTVLEFSKRAEQQNRPFFTHFYNKDWMHQLMSQYVPQNAGLVYSFLGGYETAERQILMISPYELEMQSELIGALNIEVRTGLGKALSHRDYLGSIMGLGIERNVVGDIILHEAGAYVLVEKAMVPYITSQLFSIGKYQKMTISEVALQDLKIAEPKTKQLEVTVSALRMDAVCAAAFGVSRSECVKLIGQDKARCNGLAIQASDLIKAGDTLTLRGYGKAQLKSVNGRTKKERTHITIEKYI